MVNLRVAGDEMACENNFRNLGPVYNANTSENYPIIFVSEEDFKAGMSILAICVRMHPNVRVFAFQLMSNHIHLVIGGDSQVILEFFEYYAERLNKFFDGRICLNDLSLKLFPIGDLSYMRNAIAYVNRNGFVINNNVTPFSYPWGSSPYFFQPMAVGYSILSGEPIGIQKLRALMHTRICDSFKGLKVIDGYVSPLEFCDVSSAESLFRDAKQYFYLISRNVEMYSEIAKSIGESIFVNDNDLYIAAVKLAREQFSTNDLRTLDTGCKIELARRLHFDYNAGTKQIGRLLKIDNNLLNALSL